MAEKRKLPARERREPAAKRRVSEAASQSSRRRKTSTPATAAQSSTPIPEVEPERQPTPEPIEEPLPTKIKEGDPLPTRSKPQPTLALSDKEFQSIAESVVLSMSLERSKKKWLSDGIFERYWTKPKKTKREQLEGKNPPKDSMTKIGPCKIIIEPHHFDGMIYTVKDPNAKPAVQIPPPQRHIVQYGPPATGYQYQHYAPPQQMRPPPYPYNQPPNPQNAPPHPRPQQPPPIQRHPTAQVQGPPPQPAKPSPDPVIQMLATRAASNPELKALMRIVASSKASQEQLRIFQGHIDELNAIIRQRDEQQRRQQQQQNNHYQQSQQSPQPPPSQTPPGQAAPPTPQQVAPKPPQQNSQQPQNTPTPVPSLTPAPEPSSTPDSASTPVQAKPQSSPPPQSQTSTPAPTSNSANTQTDTAPSVGQPDVSNPSDSTANATPQVKTEPGNPAAIVPAAPPTPTQASAASTSTVSNVPTPAPAPSAVPVLTPAAPSPVPPHAPQASPVPNPVLTNPSPQPLSPYPAGPSQYPQYHQPPYPHAPPPIKARSGPQYGSSAYYQSGPAPPPPKPPIKAVVFEFTSPLTPYGSSTSGHAGSGDRYLFPEYSILEYQAGGTILLASFLLVRKVDPNTKFPLELTSDVAPKSKSKSSKSKKKDKEKAAEKSGPSTPAPEIENQGVDEKKETKATGSNTTDEKKPLESGDKASSSTTEQPTKENATNFKEYYQPLTLRLYSSKPATLEPLSRIVKPAAEVRKYMEEIMERAERAPAGFLPFRLPREKPFKTDDDSEAITTTTAATTTAAEGDKPKTGDQTGEADEVVDDTAGGLETEGLEFLLKDFYEPPNGLVPIRV